MSLKFLYMGVGISIMFALSMLAPSLNIVLGPSANTRMMCKELEKEGYLTDECFYSDGMLKDRSCKKDPAP